MRWKDLLLFENTYSSFIWKLRTQIQNYPFFFIFKIATPQTYIYDLKFCQKIVYVFDHYMYKMAGHLLRLQ